ncbi:MAG: PAS domain S-box protein [Deltaproteobacteria bacterium]|nr:PAS domain S-box protein [Deltaproteobacteria bacterium]
MPARRGGRGLLTDYTNVVSRLSAFSDPAALFAALLGGTPVPTLICGPDGETLLVTPSLPRVLGWTPPPGHNLARDGIPGLPPVGDLFARCLADGTIPLPLCGYDRPEREGAPTERLALEGYMMRAQSATGETVAVVVIYRDVTERLRELHAVRAAETQLRTVVSHAPVVLFGLDRAGNVTFADGQGLDAIGLRGHELLGRSAVEAVRTLPPEAGVLLRRALTGREAAWSGAVAGRVFDLRLFPQCDSHGALSGVLGLAQDVTERHRAQEAAEARERRFRALVEHGADVITLHREDGTILYASSSVRHVLGYEVDELVGRHPTEFQHPEDRLHVEAQGARMLQSPGVPVTARYRVRRKDGAWRWIEGRATNLLHDQDVRAVVVNQHDVTESHEAQAALVEREQMLEDAQSLSLMGSFISNAEGRFLSASPSLYRILGLPENTPLSFATIMQLIHPDDIPSAVSARERALATREGFDLEHRIYHPDGRERWIRVVTKIMIPPGGQATYALGTVQDLTDRKQLEAQLVQSQRMEAVGRLAGGIAHDFNNVLSAISGFGQVVHDALGEHDPLREDMAQVLEASERAAQLTRQLLAFSRRQVLQPQVLDLNERLPEMSRMLRRIIGEDVELELKLAPGTAPIKVDPGQLEQVVVNLAVNARDSMPDGGLLTVATEELPARAADATPGLRAGSERRILLRVTDSGSGMDRATIERVFEPFFTTKGLGQGTGLGLSTVHGIVEQSGGNITVESEQGIGTTFRIVLPRTDEPLTATAIHPVAPGRKENHETLLVVEDDDAVRLFARRWLRQAGYRVLEARNGGEALLTIEQHPGPVHLLITDVIMPRISGKQLAERLRAARPGLKVLYMSGYSDEVIAHHGVLEPGVLLLEKPLSGPALEQKVREALRTT